MNHDESTTDSLLMFAAGRLDREDADVIGGHLRDCAECAATVARARAIADVLLEQHQGAMAIEDPPERVARMAAGLFAKVRPDLVRETIPVAAPDLGLPARGVRRIVAELIFDSSGSGAYAGLRSASRTSRHLAYHSELGDLDIQATPPLRSSAADAEWQVMGQLDLVDPIPPGTAISFIRENGADSGHVVTGEEYTSAAIDGSGYFSVDLASGVWSAHLVVAQVIVVFPGIEL